MNNFTRALAKIRGTVVMVDPDPDEFPIRLALAGFDSNRFERMVVEWRQVSHGDVLKIGYSGFVVVLLSYQDGTKVVSENIGFRTETPVAFRTRRLHGAFLSYKMREPLDRVATVFRPSGPASLDWFCAINDTVRNMEVTK